MNKRRIIGFAGRLESGKTMLADKCVERGYTRLYFALPLKELVREITGYASIDELNKNKNTHHDYTFAVGEHIGYISKKTGIEAPKIRKALIGKNLDSVRNLLQVIGTDVIRMHNKDWHVNEIRKILDSDEFCDKNIVFDDVRFPNEADLIEELEGEVWFVIRNKYDNISHHPSEESLSVSSFRKIILNTKDKESALNKVEYILKHEDSWIKDSVFDEETNEYESYFLLNPNDIRSKIACIPINPRGDARIEVKNNDTLVLNDGKNIFEYKNYILLEECKRFLNDERYTKKDFLTYKEQIEKFIDEHSLDQNSLLLNCYIKATIETLMKRRYSEIRLEGCAQKDSMSAPFGDGERIEWETHYTRIFFDNFDKIVFGYYEVDSNGERSIEYIEKLEEADIETSITLLNALKDKLSV